MRIALLGSDPTIAPWIEDLSRDPAHEVVARYDDHPGTIDPFASLPAPAPEADWEALLTGETADLVVVARGHDNAVRREQILQLLRQKLPVVVSHPISDSPLDYYELEMVHREFGGGLWAWRPASGHPIVLAFKRWLHHDENHADLSIQLARSTTSSTNAARREALVRDIALLREAVGEPVRVTGVIDDAVPPRYTELTFHFGSRRPVRWSWTIGTEDYTEVTASSNGESATAMFPLDPRQWSLKIDNEKIVAGALANLPWQGVPSIKAALTQASASNWRDATGDIEIMEAVERSLARGRVVELRPLVQDEEANFKGVMAATGCLLLLAAMAVLLAVAVGQQLAAELKAAALARVLGQWPWMLLALFLVFLVSQGLLLVARRPHSSRSASQPSLDKNSS